MVPVRVESTLGDEPGMMALGDRAQQGTAPAGHKNNNYKTKLSRTFCFPFCFVFEALLSRTYTRKFKSTF